MIRAIIFDCFGVLTTDGWLPFKEQYFGHDPALMQEASDLNKQTDAGLLDYRTYIRRLADLAQVPPQKVQAALEKNVANEALFVYIGTTLKPRFKIGMLSNAARDWREKLFGAERAALFDAVALSCDMGFIKPDPQAYATIADRLDVRLEDCLFVDDQERYVTAARDAGMLGIHYQGFEQFEKEISPQL